MLDHKPTKESHAELIEIVSQWMQAIRYIFSSFFLLSVVSLDLIGCNIFGPLGHFCHLKKLL